MRSRFGSLFVLAGLASQADAQSINITSATIRLYELDGGFVMSEAKRVYTNYFNTLRTRRIGVEVSLEYAAAPMVSKLSVGCQMTRPDGRVVDGIWKIGIGIGANSTSASGANTLFGAGPAGWQPGVYKVTCSSGRPLGETQFQMSSGPSLLQDTEIRLKDVKFFGTGPSMQALAQREYQVRFSAAEATRIAIELTFVGPPSGKTGQFPVDCYYLSRYGNVVGTMTGTYDIEPAGTGGTVAMGMGWDQPGNWEKGDYLAICQIHGRPISIDRFTVW